MGRQKLVGRRRRAKSSKTPGPSLPNLDEGELALHPFSLVAALRVSPAPPRNEGVKALRTKRKSRKQKR